jgi:hypothetical protein
VSRVFYLSFLSYLTYSTNSSYVSYLIYLSNSTNSTYLSYMSNMNFLSDVSFCRTQHLTGLVLSVLTFYLGLLILLDWLVFVLLNSLGLCVFYDFLVSNVLLALLVLLDSFHWTYFDLFSTLLTFILTIVSHLTLSSHGMVCLS